MGADAEFVGNLAGFQSVGAKLDDFQFAPGEDNVVLLPRHFDGMDDLERVCLFGQESIMAAYRNQMNSVPKKMREKWFDYAVNYCDKEDYLTHSEHLMAVCRKTR